MSIHQLLMIVPITWSSDHDRADSEVVEAAVRAFERDGMPNAIVHAIRRVEPGQLHERLIANYVEQ